MKDDIKTKTPTLIQNKIFSNHFNWRGEINNNNALDFLNTQLDVLVSYYDTKNNYLNLMTSKSKAKFKVGFNGVDDRLFDLIINVDPQKNLDVKSELLKYFKGDELAANVWFSDQYFCHFDSTSIGLYFIKFKFFLFMLFCFCKCESDCKFTFIVRKLKLWTLLSLFKEILCYFYTLIL